MNHETNNQSNDEHPTFITMIGAEASEREFDNVPQIFITSSPGNRRTSTLQRNFSLSSSSPHRIQLQQPNTRTATTSPLSPLSPTMTNSRSINHQQSSIRNDQPSFRLFTNRQSIARPDGRTIVLKNPYDNSVHSNNQILQMLEEEMKEVSKELLINSNNNSRPVISSKLLNIPPPAYSTDDMESARETPYSSAYGSDITSPSSSLLMRNDDRQQLTGQSSINSLQSPNFQIEFHTIPERKPSPFPSSDVLGICKKCKKYVFETDDACRALNTSVFHATCFRCTECYETLRGSQYYFVDMNHIYCEKDYKRLFLCNHCDRMIGDSSNEKISIIIDNKHYYFHQNCFNCRQCNYPLTDVFRIDKNLQLYCTNCFS
ncbi:hypothetical protein SNEBB_008704 [Seison nebaliae]|nr:hypothetical protein SNEBB_008704 [Seison nebaliae]